MAVTDWGGANSRFLGLVSVGAAGSSDQMAFSRLTSERRAQHWSPNKQNFAKINTFANKNVFVSNQFSF